MYFDYETDLEVCMNYAVWDIDQGTILKIADGKVITHAMKGFHNLEKEEIIKIYGEK